MQHIMQAGMHTAWHGHKGAQFMASADDSRAWKSRRFAILASLREAKVSLYYAYHVHRLMYRSQGCQQGSSRLEGSFTALGRSLHLFPGDAQVGLRPGLILRL